MIFPRAQLQNTIDFAWNNMHSSFYKNYLKSYGIKTVPKIKNVSDWENIPYSTKKDFESVQNPADRTFVPMSDVDVLHTTSGTSGTSPLLFWRTFEKNKERHKILQKHRGERAMYVGGYERSLHSLIPMQENGIPTISGNARTIDETAEMAMQGNITILMASATSLILLSEKFGTYSQKISFLFLWGEPCSAQTYRLLKKKYPNAFFSFTYGQSEAGGAIASSTEACSAPSTIMHLHEKSFFVEIDKGELILTTLSTPLPTPLIKYRTGDAAQFIAEACPCGKNEQRIEILGRIKNDVIRIAGGEIRTEELDRVMEPFFPYIEPTYQLIVDEIIEDSDRIGKLVLHITVRENVSTPTKSLVSKIAQEINENMHLSQNMRYKDALAANLLRPLEIICVPKPASSVKHLKIIKKF